MAVINVIAALIKEPRLATNGLFPLSNDDFPERFHKIVFTAIEHLASTGVQELDEIVIDNYISAYPAQYKLFTENSGMEYIAQAISITAEENFVYYYTMLKKCSLLNALYEQGFNISQFYDPQAISIEDQQAVQTKLDTFTLDEIIATYEGVLSSIKSLFNGGSGRKCVQAGVGMRQLKERLKETPEMGMPMNSKKMTTIFRGRRLKKFYMKTMPTGVGKTRLSLADACMISIPQIYDIEQRKWVRTNCQEPTLFVTTELEIDEVQTMIKAYVSGVPEDHILDGKYGEGEEKRVDRAIDIIEKSSLYLEQIPDFNIDDVENVIRDHKAKHNVRYVFFDYIYTSIKILMEISSKAKGVRIREDNVLIMFADRMKGLCNSLGVHIDTSTQANGDWKTMKDPDQNIIRGAKGMSDKVDIGYCGLEPTQSDLEAVRGIMSQQGRAFFAEPNLVYHIYKVRRGKINHVKLFVRFDYGTLRTTDLFVTDKDYKLLDVENTDIELVLDSTVVADATTAQKTFAW